MKGLKRVSCTYTQAQDLAKKSKQKKTYGICMEKVVCFIAKLNSLNDYKLFREAVDR